jgi:predicted DNA binding CopG/RHH family protein
MSGGTKPAIDRVEQTARRLAAQKGLGYQTYIKMLLRKALAKKSEEEPSRTSR